jgi:hypothetical protein
MMGGTKDGAQMAISIRLRCVGEVDPETVTHIYTQELNPVYILGYIPRQLATLDGPLPIYAHNTDIA